MRKKIGILTINDDSNYGNRLQNYAVQKIFENLGEKAETIVNMTNVDDKNYNKIRIKRFLRLHLFFSVERYQRAINFDKFNLNIKRAVRVIKNEKDTKKIANRYKTFFTGSDQVWNPYFKRTSSVDFLTFAPKEKRNSLSASFGVDEIPEEKIKIYKKYLENMNYISVRENEGKKIIERITGRKDVEVLLDPTMALTEIEWQKLERKPKKFENQKYIFIYFLGKISDDKKEIINRIANKKGYKIINILDKNSPFFSCGPSEFLYLEKNAQLICTDSFHSVVFSILYKRPFLVFKRDDDLKNMNSRINTLLKKFNLENRIWDNKLLVNGDIWKIDYSHTKMIIDSERNHTYNFIKKVLSEEN